VARRLFGVSKILMWILIFKRLYRFQTRMSYNQSIRFCIWYLYNHAEYPAVNLSANFSRYPPKRSLIFLCERGSKPCIYCHRSTHYIVHCVGDVGTATSSCQRGMNSSFVSQPCILGLVSSLTEWCNTPGRPGCSLVWFAETGTL
jgi:hypothetical protein